MTQSLCRSETSFKVDVAVIFEEPSDAGQFPHKTVTSLSKSVIVDNKLSILWGS